MVKTSYTKTSDRQLPNTPGPISPSKKISEKFDHLVSTTAVNCGSFYSDNEKLSTLFGFIDKQTLQSEISLGTHAFSEENRESSAPASTQSCDKGNHKNSPSATMIQPSFEDNHQNLSTAIEIPDSLKENHGMLPLGYTSPNTGSEDEQTSDDELPIKCQNITEEKEDKSQSECTRLTLITCSVMCAPLYNGQMHVNNRSIRSPENDTPLLDSATKSFNLAFGQQTYGCHGDKRSVGGYVHKNDTVVIATPLNSIGKYGPHKSTYRGVTRHKWTGKFEAHLWDGNCSTVGRTRKGKQVYLGGYETAEEAARAHDLTALKYWGLSASVKLNFPISNYEKELEKMESMSREELVTFLRRQSLSFTRGSSIYRGVTSFCARNSSAFGNIVFSRNCEGHWQARIKVPTSKKDIYLGTFSSEEEAARAYDIAAIRLKGINALTNFDISNYLHGDLKEIEGFRKPKRVRRSGKSSAITSGSETDHHPDEGIAQSNSPLDEITRRKFAALLPDHPTAMIPN